MKWDVTFPKNLLKYHKVEGLNSRLNKYDENEKKQ